MKNLLIRIGGFGDCLQVTEAFRSCGYRFEDCGLICDNLFGQIAGQFSFGAVHTLPANTFVASSLKEKLIATLRIWAILLRHRPEVVHVLHHDDRYGLLVLPYRLLGLGGRIRKFSFDGYGNVPLLAAYQAFLAQGSTGGPISRIDFPVASGPVTPKSRLATVLVASHENAANPWLANRYPALSEYLEIVSTLQQRGFLVTLVGSTHSAELAERIVSRLGTVSSKVGTASFVETLATVAGSGLYVGFDSGITHWAAYAKVPGIAFFGATEARRYYWPGSSLVYVQGGEDLVCSPCHLIRHLRKCANNVCVRSINYREELTNLIASGNADLPIK